MKSVYVVIANDEHLVKECIVTEDNDVAVATWLALKEIWGVPNVAFVSRRVNDIPKNITEYWQASNTACSRPTIMRRLASWLKTNINLGRGG